MKECVFESIWVVFGPERWRVESQIANANARAQRRIVVDWGEEPLEAVDGRVKGVFLKVSLKNRSFACTKKVALLVMLGSWNCASSFFGFLLRNLFWLIFESCSKGIFKADLKSQKQKNGFKNYSRVKFLNLANKDFLTQLERSFVHYFCIKRLVEMRLLSKRKIPLTFFSSNLPSYKLIIFSATSPVSFSCSSSNGSSQIASNLSAFRMMVSAR